jgi:hypothetical protein
MGRKEKNERGSFEWKIPRSHSAIGSIDSLSLLSLRGSRKGSQGCAMVVVDNADRSLSRVGSHDDVGCDKH